MHMEFQKGDKVKIIHLTEYSYYVKVGDVGIVDYVDYGSSFPIRLNINNEEDYGFKKDELELVNKTIPHYPEEFDDFSDGVGIKDSEINKWIKECIDGINKGEKDFWCISSGNTKVIVLKYDDGYEINVSKGYQEYIKYSNEE